MLGATYAGIAFSNSSVALVHGMSRPIGAHFHVPHGLSNAMLLPLVTAFSSAARARSIRALRGGDGHRGRTGHERPGGRAAHSASSAALNRELAVLSPRDCECPRTTGGG